jgi:hypothetical protein
MSKQSPPRTLELIAEELAKALDKGLSLLAEAIVAGRLNPDLVFGSSKPEGMEDIPDAQKLFLFTAVFARSSVPPILLELETSVEKLGVFLDRNEYEETLFEEVAAQLRARYTQSGQPTPLDRARLVSVLREPKVREANFKIWLAAESRWTPELHIPGGTLAGDRSSLVFSGVARARSEYSAVRQVEERVEEILGCLLAFGALEIRRECLVEPGDAGHLWLGEHIMEHALSVRPDLAGAMARAVVSPPTPTEMEKELGERGQARANERVASHLQRLLRGAEVGTASLRSGARLLFRAESAYEDGQAINLACTALEAVLLDDNTTDNVLGRLSEAVAYRIGGSRREREDLRRETKRYYEVRSRFAHTGLTRAGFGARAGCIDLVIRVLSKEISEYAED